MIPSEAIQAILEAEGVDQPYAWPGGGSGITLGYGYDIGAGDYRASFVNDWGQFLNADQMRRLSTAFGITGEKARAMARQFRDIRIKRDDAHKVFINATLPKYEGQTKKAFPGIENLPALVFGALVSLVFNRGAAMEGDRRREMKEIRDKCIPARDLKCIAKNLRSMKRLWQGQGLDGLLKRRETEAQLVEKAIT